MSDQFLDMLVASDVANMNTIAAVHQEGIHQRAQNIEDNFGIKPQSIESYRKEHDPDRLLKTVAWVGAGVALGMLFAGAAALTAGIMWGAFGGLVVGGVIASFKGKKVEQGYSDYLDRTAAQGRAERGVGKGVEYDNGSGRVNYGAELAAERARAAYLAHQR